MKPSSSKTKTKKYKAEENGNTILQTEFKIFKEVFRIWGKKI
jgi:hypothetical protein